MTTRNHANLREGGTELERVAQNKLHEMLMIEYGFVTENVEPMKALLTTYAQTVAEEAVRVERERIVNELRLMDEPDNDGCRPVYTAAELAKILTLTPPTK